MEHCAEMEQRILPALSKDTIAKLNVITAKANMMWILRDYFLIKNFDSMKNLFTFAVPKRKEPPWERIGAVVQPG